MSCSPSSWDDKPFITLVKAQQKLLKVGSARSKVTKSEAIRSEANATVPVNGVKCFRCSYGAQSHHRGIGGCQVGQSSCKDDRSFEIWVR